MSLAVMVVEFRIGASRDLRPQAPASLTPDFNLERPKVFSPRQTEMPSSSSAGT